MVDQVSLLRLRVLAQADSGALMRTLERFQNLGVVAADGRIIENDLTGRVAAHHHPIA